MIFRIFLDFVAICLIFLDFCGVFRFLEIYCFDIFLFFFFFSKLLRLLLNVTEVTTEHQKWPKISTNSVKSSFIARRGKKASAEGRSPSQELEVSPRSRLYLIVFS